MINQSTLLCRLDVLPQSALWSCNNNLNEIMATARSNLSFQHCEIPCTHGDPRGSLGTPSGFPREPLGIAWRDTEETQSVGFLQESLWESLGVAFCQESLGNPFFGRESLGILRGGPLVGAAAPEEPTAAPPSSR